MSAASLVGELAKSISSSALIVSDDPRYEQARLVWNGIADRRPAAIVKARNSNDIKVAIRAAAAHGALLAVRCGGHSLPGLSTCDDGIVLDLSKMNSVSIDPPTRTAVVGGGALLGDLDRAGAAHGLVVPAGVVSHTGAAGLTLGGGMGWLSRRFGLTIDSLNSIDLITADGSEVHASMDSEPELFWGLRGGGGNFGVVTRFTYTMHPLGPVFAGTWQYPVSNAAQLLGKFHELSNRAPREMTTSLNLASTCLYVTAFWSGDGGIASKMLAPFGNLAAGALGSQFETSYAAHQSRSDETMRWGRRYYSKGGFFGDFTEGIIAELTSAMASMPTPDSDIYIIQLGGAIGDVGDADTAYTGRAAKYYWIASPVWDDPADDKRCIAWGRSVAAKLAALSMSGNYVNEQADAGSDIALGAYGNAKYRRLQKLKACFDPGNLFRLNQNIEPRA